MMTPKATHWNTQTSTPMLALGLLLLLAVSFYLLFDRLAAVSLYLGPTLAYCGFWTIIGLLLLYTRPVKYKLLVPVVVLVLILPIRFIDWDARKPFLRDLYRVEPGMTEVQVERIMGGYLQGSSWPANPNPAAAEPGELIVPETVIYRHTNAGWGDSDWGLVRYQDGRVVAVEFSAD